MSSLWPVLITAVLILLNGCFVAAEFAIIGVSRMEVERVTRERRRGAALLRWIVDDPVRQDRFIATAQLGITAASLGLGMYAEHELAAWIAVHLEQWGAARWIPAHAVATGVSLAILTYLHIVIGEMVPKALALAYPARTALGVVHLMRGLQLLVYPLVLALNGVGNWILSLFGIVRSESGVERYRTPEELAYIVRESAAGGMLRGKSARVVTELLDFGNLTAEDVMVPRVRITALPRETAIASLRQALSESPFTRYPVYDGSLDNIVGMLHIRDIVASGVQQDPVPPELIRAVPHLPGTTTTDDVLEAMRQAGVQMAVVMDEHGGTAGVLTLEDLFEEVVGDIRERLGDQPNVRLDGGALHVDGAVRLDEVAEALGASVEHDDVDTVSGLVLALLGGPPEVGDEVEFAGLRFTVIEIRGHGVAQCRIEQLESSEADDDHSDA